MKVVLECCANRFRRVRCAGEKHTERTSLIGGVVLAEITLEDKYIVQLVWLQASTF